MILAVEKSGDKKLTADFNVSATWVPQQTCPSECPLRKNGCYAEVGNAGLHTHRLNKRTKRAHVKLSEMRRKLASEEAAGIRGLTGLRKLRVHVVGDCPTALSANKVGRAMVSHEKKHGKFAWTYTHSWRTVLASAWKGARVLASCHSAKEVRQALERGYATALTVPKHRSDKIYQYDGLTIVPCPAQFFRPDGKRRATCEHCTICQRPDMLRARKLVVGFEPDGNSTKRLLNVINAAKT